MLAQTAAIPAKHTTIRKGRTLRTKLVQYETANDTERNTEQTAQATKEICRSRIKSIDVDKHSGVVIDVEVQNKPAKQLRNADSNKGLQFKNRCDTAVGGSLVACANRDRLLNFLHNEEEQDSKQCNHGGGYPPNTNQAGCLGDREHGIKRQGGANCSRTSYTDR